MRLSRFLTRRRRDEIGTVAILIAMFFAFLAIPLGAVAVDVARMYVELERVQAAADAAATAGVTYMPDDFASARARAIAIAEDNGYPNSGRTSVTVEAGEKPTQLKVTVSSTVDNAFAKSFGVSTSRVSRSAVADFNGPAPMGSPCNTFGNEPAGSSVLGPQGSVNKTPDFADCTDAQYWAQISGPEVVKNQGSQFEARKCSGIEDGCSAKTVGATNTDFDSRGYVYLVRVAQSGVGVPTTVQIYDPAYVATGLRCTSEPYNGPGNTTAPTTSGNGNWGQSWNPFVSDARQRYWRTGSSWGLSPLGIPIVDTSKPNAFCSGDDPSAGNYFGNDDVATITSYTLRQPIDTLVPYDALPVSGCTRQYPGYNTDDVSLQTLRDSDTRYNANIAKVFHQWVPLCTFTPSKAGDYYLQVRTNVALGGTSDGAGGYVGNTAPYTQVGDDTSVKGTGINSFGLRAVSSGAAGSVTVAAYERMRIYANADGATTEFNLVRVAPAAANKTLVVTFFDVGEGATNGSVKLLKPADSNLPTNVQNCKGYGVKEGDLSNCEITGISSTNYNGKLQEIRVQIPNTYTCQVASQGGCWFRMRVSFGVGSVNDATTWTARITGEPVRLIE